MNFAFLGLVKFSRKIFALNVSIWEKRSNRREINLLLNKIFPLNKYVEEPADVFPSTCNPSHTEPAGVFPYPCNPSHTEPAGVIPYPLQTFSHWKACHIQCMATHASGIPFEWHRLKLGLFLSTQGNRRSEWHYRTVTERFKLCTGSYISLARQWRSTNYSTTYSVDLLSCSRGPCVLCTNTVTCQNLGTRTI